MTRRIRRAKHGPEWHIQRELVRFLRERGWLCERMIGNALQYGIPDLFCHHPRWGSRWIDVKRPKEFSLTRRQRVKWPVWGRFGCGIWILSAADQQQYDLLFGPPNWRAYWKPRYGEIPDVDALLAEMDKGEAEISAGSPRFTRNGRH